MSKLVDSLDGLFAASAVWEDGSKGARGSSSVFAFELTFSSVGSWKPHYGSIFQLVKSNLEQFELINHIDSKDSEKAESVKKCTTHNIRNGPDWTIEFAASVLKKLKLDILCKAKRFLNGKYLHCGCRLAMA